MDQHEKERNMGSSAERNERKAADGKSGAGYRQNMIRWVRFSCRRTGTGVRRHSAAT